MLGAQRERGKKKVGKSKCEPGKYKSLRDTEEKEEEQRERKNKGEKDK